MIHLEVSGLTFHVEFRHLRRGKKRGPLPPFTDAVTTCVIVATDRDKSVRFTAIGNTFCWDLDNFSRRMGRLKAFSNAVNECGALRGSKMALIAAYMLKDPDKPKPGRLEMQQREKTERWGAGAGKRLERALAREKRKAARNYRDAIDSEAAQGRGAV